MKCTVSEPSMEHEFQGHDSVQTNLWHKEYNETVEGRHTRKNLERDAVRRRN